jgi:hypothetical protein
MRTQKVLIAMNVVLISIILIGWSSGLQKQDFSEIRIKDKNGKTKIELSIDENGNPQIVLFDKSGIARHWHGFEKDSGEPFVDVAGTMQSRGYILSNKNSHLVGEWVNLYGDDELSEWSWSRWRSYLPDGQVGIELRGGVMERISQITLEAGVMPAISVNSNSRKIYELGTTESGLAREVYYDHVGRNRLQSGFDAKELPAVLLSDERGEVKKQMY